MSSELDVIYLTTYNALTTTVCSNDRNRMLRKLMSTQQEDDAPNFPPGTVSLHGRIANIMTPRFVRKVVELHKLTTREASTSEQDKDLPDLLAQKSRSCTKYLRTSSHGTPLRRCPMIDDGNAFSASSRCSSSWAHSCALWTATPSHVQPWKL